MSTDSYVKDIADERQRLERLTQGRSEAELSRDLGRDWTVATKLLHLAFWDHYTAALLRKWKSSGLAESAFDTDALNEAVRVLSRSIAPQEAVELARAAAAVVDREAAGVTPALKEAIEKAGRSRSLQRSLHRRAHLDQIDGVLGK